MEFDLDRSAGERFQFFRSVQDDDGEIVYSLPKEDEPCWVTLRLADPDFLAGVHAKTRTPVTVNALHTKSRAMVRIKDFDQTPEQEKLESELIWDHAIMGWEGVLDKDGKVVECNSKNKTRMMRVPIFARFVGKCMTMITGAAEEVVKEQRKNSSPG